MNKLILASAAALLMGTSLSFAAMPVVDVGDLLSADNSGLQLVRNGGDDGGGDDHGGGGNSGHGGGGNSGHGGGDDDGDDDHGGDDDGDDDRGDDDNDDNAGGSGRDKPRIPGGSGCDDAGDIAEHAECTP